MKAYMSNPWRKSLAEIGHLNAELSTYAIFEARRILADVEPFRKGGADYANPKTPWVMLGIGRPAHEDGHQAFMRDIIAESLASFVAEPGQ